MSEKLWGVLPRYCEVTTRFDIANCPGSIGDMLRQSVKNRRAYLWLTKRVWDLGWYYGDLYAPNAMGDNWQ